jgi:hypothetical protein
MDSVLEYGGSDVTQSPLLSAAEFLELESEPDADTSYDLAMRSPSPPGPSRSDAHGPSASGSSANAVFASRGNVAYLDNDAQETTRHRVASRESRSWEDEFRLVSFAQGCILEEHSTVADMRIRPGELLEVSNLDVNNKGGG